MHPPIIINPPPQTLTYSSQDLQPLSEEVALSLCLPAQNRPWLIRGDNHRFLLIIIIGSHRCRQCCPTDLRPLARTECSPHTLTTCSHISPYANYHE